MERYVKKFKESDNKLKESFEFDIMNVFENNIDGYGGPGIIGYHKSMVITRLDIQLLI
jgi:hypothetical protein